MYRRLRQINSTYDVDCFLSENVFYTHVRGTKPPSTNILTFRIFMMFSHFSNVRKNCVQLRPDNGFLGLIKYASKKPSVLYIE